MDDKGYKMHGGVDIIRDEPHMHINYVKVGLTRKQQRFLVLTLLFFIVFTIISMLAALEWKRHYEELKAQNTRLTSQVTSMNQEIDKLNSEKIMLQMELEDSKK
jgi:cell division protein FtsB